MKYEKLLSQRRNRNEFSAERSNRYCIPNVKPRLVCFLLNFVITTYEKQKILETEISAFNS